MATLYRLPSVVMQRSADVIERESPDVATVMIESLSRRVVKQIAALIPRVPTVFAKSIAQHVLGVLDARPDQPVLELTDFDPAPCSTGGRYVFWTEDEPSSARISHPNLDPNAAAAFQYDRYDLPLFERIGPGSDIPAREVLSMLENQPDPRAIYTQRLSNSIPIQHLKLPFAAHDAEELLQNFAVFLTPGIRKQFPEILGCSVHDLSIPEQVIAFSVLETALPEQTEQIRNLVMEYGSDALVTLSALFFTKSSNPGQMIDTFIEYPQPELWQSFRRALGSQTVIEAELAQYQTVARNQARQITQEIFTRQARQLAKIVVGGHKASRGIDFDLAARARANTFGVLYQEGVVQSLEEVPAYTITTQQTFSAADYARMVEQYQQNYPEEFATSLIRNLPEPESKVTPDGYAFSHFTCHDESGRIMAECRIEEHDQADGKTEYFIAGLFVDPETQANHYAEAFLQTIFDQYPADARFGAYCAADKGIARLALRDLSFVADRFLFPADDSGKPIEPLPTLHVQRDMSTDHVSQEIITQVVEPAALRDGSAFAPLQQGSVLTEINVTADEQIHLVFRSGEGKMAG